MDVCSQSATALPRLGPCSFWTGVAPALDLVAMIEFIFREELTGRRMSRRHEQGMQTANLPIQFCVASSDACGKSAVKSNRYRYRLPFAIQLAPSHRKQTPASLYFPAECLRLSLRGQKPHGHTLSHVSGLSGLRVQDSLRAWTDSSESAIFSKTTSSGWSGR